MFYFSLPAETKNVDKTSTQNEIVQLLSQQQHYEKTFEELLTKRSKLEVEI